MKHEETGSIQAVHTESNVSYAYDNLVNEYTESHQIKRFQEARLWHNDDLRD